MKGDGVLGLAALVALVAWWWKREADVLELENKLIEILPSRLGQWGPQLARTANKTSPASVSPMKWALFLAAIMDRESNGGSQLKPPGAGGAGDWGGRKGGWLERDDIVLVVDELPPGWVVPRDRKGNKLPPPYAIPRDGKGWGRGLMQLDVGSYPDLLDVTTEAAGNIDRGAMQLRRLYLQLAAAMPDEDKFVRTADAYNAGPRALAAADPDALTTGGDYGADVVARAAALEEALA